MVLIESPRNTLDNSTVMLLAKVGENPDEVLISAMKRVPGGLLEPVQLTCKLPVLTEE